MSSVDFYSNVLFYLGISSIEVFKIVGTGVYVFTDLNKLGFKNTSLFYDLCIVVYD